MNLFPEKLTEDNGSIKVDGGITLRDYFATAAMQAILTGNGGSAPNRWEPSRTPTRWPMRCSM